MLCSASFKVFILLDFIHSMYFIWTYILLLLFRGFIFHLMSCIVFIVLFYNHYQMGFILRLVLHSLSISAFLSLLYFL